MRSRSPFNPPDASLPAFALAFWILAIFQLSAADPRSTPPIRTIQEIRRTPRAVLEQITNSVEIEGVVTFTSPRWSLCFIHDSTAGIYVFGPALPENLVSGEKVMVTGVPRPGGFAPSLRVTGLRRLGTSPLPDPRPANAEHLTSGAEDGQWITVEGAVRSSIDLDGTVWNLAGELGNFQVLFAGPPIGPAGQPWVGSWVKIRGVGATSFNPRGQFLTYKLLVRDIQDVERLRPAHPEPFNLPLTPLDRVLEFDLTAEPGRRVHVRGVVTWTDHRQTFQIQNGLHGIEAQSTPDGGVPELGDEVDVVAFPSPGGVTPILQFATWRRQRPGTPPNPVLLDLNRIQTDQDGLLVTVEASFLDAVDVAEGSEIGLRDPAGRHLRALFPAGIQALSLPALEPGTPVRLTGVYRVSTEPAASPSGHQIRARARTDLAVVGRATWWNTRRATWLALALGVMTAGGLAWTATLRQRLTLQRNELETQHSKRLTLEQIHRRLTEGAPDAIFTIDPRGMILSANPAAMTFSGYTEGELQRMSILDLLPSAERASLATKLAVRFDPNRTDHEVSGDEDPFLVEIIDRQHRRRTMEVTSRILDGPGGERYLEGMARDVTERKRAEDALKALASMAAQGGGEEFFRTVTRQIADLLGVQYVFVATLAPGHPRTLQVPVLFTAGEFAAPTQFEIAGSPWENPADKSERLVSHDAQVRYRHDSRLAAWNIESLVGLPLAAQDAESHGFLGLLHVRPFEPTTTQLDMLRVLAARVGSEIARLRASEALRASEERFRQLAEESEDVLWVVDLPSSRLAYLGPSFARIAGLPPGEKPRSLRHVLRLIHPEDRPGLLAAARAGLSQPDSRYSTEFRIIRPDQSTRWILDQGVLIRNAQGRAIRLNGVARDITPRKSAELALTAERVRFQELFENSPDAILVESLEGIVLDVNQAGCQLHRLARGQIIGRHISDLAPPELRDDVRRSFERIMAGEAGPMEGISLCSNGEHVPVEFRATHIRHHGVDALLFHVRDITARHQAAEFMAGQMRILEWIATARPLPELLTELVRIVEARAAGARCWIHWWSESESSPVNLIAPSVSPETRAHLLSSAAHAKSPGRDFPHTYEIGAPPTPADPASPSESGDSQATSVPIVSPSGRHLGALTVQFSSEPAAPPITSDVHRLAASLAGIAIEREILDASLREGADQLRTANAELLLLARSEAVSQGDLGVALQEITVAAAQSVRVGRVSVWIFEDASTLLRCVHLLDEHQSPDAPPLEIGVGDFPSYFEAIAHERLVAIADAESDPRARELLGPYLHPYEVTATIDAGIRLRGNLVGVVCFEHRGGRRPWKTEEELIAGSIADIVAMAIQASERRCIEEALRQSEEAYRSVVGALAEGVMLISRDGAFLTFNESAAEILGFTQDQIGQRRLSDFANQTFNPDGTPLAPENYPAAITLRTGQPITDSSMAIRRADGRTVSLSINSRPFGRDETGTITSVVVSFTDISRRLEAERALREGNELLQAISGVQAGFIADGDAARTLDLMLSNLISMTGSEHGVVAQIGPDRQPEGFRLFFPDPTIIVHPNLAQDIWRPLIARVLESGRAETAATTLHPAIGGGETATDPLPSCELLALPLRHDETVVGLIGLARPGLPYPPETISRLQPLLITCANLLRAMETDRQRQQAEAQIRQFNAELEQRVELRTADLRAMNQELAEFAYVVTHDLKAPLRGIHQLSEWLAHDHATQLDAGGLRLLALLRQRVLHLQRLIDGLLACARVGRSPEPERAVATLELVRQIVVVIAPPTHITFQISNDLPSIEGNPDRLHQIFQNLLDNAVKYLDKPRGRISVNATRERGAWVFNVADNGPGIPERYREKVFQIFQRLHQTGDIPGTGLGLTLVKRIVEARGGRIWIESEGVGTTVCFTWPDKGRPRTVSWEAAALPSRVGMSSPPGSPAA